MSGPDQERMDAIRERYKRLPRSSDIDYLLAHIDKLEREIALATHLLRGHGDRMGEQAFRIQDLEAENQRLREVLRPFAETSITEHEAANIHDRIIEATGDGMWAAWFYDLCTKHLPRATEALEADDEA